MEIKSSIQSFNLSALEYIQLFSCFVFHFSPCLYEHINFYRVATTAWLLASSFPSNIDTHLFKSIDVPIVTDSFGGKNKFTCQLEQRSMGMGEQQGERNCGRGLFRLTDRKTFSNNIFKGCIMLH